jgi:hypothetical protein
MDGEDQRLERWKSDCAPMNNEICIVETSEGVYTLGYQHFGEWNDLFKDVFIDHDNVKRWRHAESEDWGLLREMLKKIG